MSGQDDFATSLKAIMAARREELGEPPTPDELLDYRDGRLDPEARRRVEAKLMVHPDAARALADLAAFPAVEPAAGTPILAEEEIEARWRTFQRRLAELPPPESIQAAPEPRTAASVATPRLPRNRRGLAALRLAASVGVGLVVGWSAGYLAGRPSRVASRAAINVHIGELAPIGEGGTRSVQSGVRLPDSSEELVLLLGTRDEREFPDYAVEVIDGNGERLWSRSGLKPTPLGTFQVSFRRSLLKPGIYRILLYGRTGERRTLLERYELRLVAAPT